MKISLLIISVLLLSSCNKSLKNDALIRARLVVNTCGVKVVRVLDEHYYNLCQNTWTSITGQSYSHVFMVSNYCYFNSPEVNKEFYFQLTSFTQPNNCLACYTDEKAPDISQSIQYVKPD